MFVYGFHHSFDVHILLALVKDVIILEQKREEF